MARAGVIGLDLGGTKIAAALFQAHGEPAAGVGIAVPGIYRAATETVWAPNIPGWDDYPLVAEVRGAVPDGMTVRVDSDRACAILGEVWRGGAVGARNAVFLVVGTGIGAGILVRSRGQFCRVPNQTSSPATSSRASKERSIVGATPRSQHPS